MRFGGEDVRLLIGWNFGEELIGQVMELFGEFNASTFLETESQFIRNGGKSWKIIFGVNGFWRL